MNKISNKKALLRFKKLCESIRKGISVDLTKSQSDIKKHRKELEDDPEEWKRFFFPKFFKYKSPDFHGKATKRLLKNFLKLRHWYEVRHWSRGLSKTTLAMMDVLYLVLTGKLHNIIYTSSTFDDAAGFLERYRAQLQANPRIKQYYGEQKLDGSWQMGNFTTRNGTKFLALGAGQSPRGNGNEEIRPDCIIVDDFDTDEECLNTDIINKKWRWFENALFFTVDTAEPYLILWLGNIIAEDCCVVRAGAKADHCEIINVRDENGNSVWPEKNSEEDIDYQLSKVSYESGQQEMFNNPIVAGKSFPELTFGKVPLLKTQKFVISYADPSTSNKDKPTIASRALNSCKANVIVGYKDFIFYVYKVWVDHTSQAKFIDWLYNGKDYVGVKTILKPYIENNKLQDPFYQLALKPLIRERAKALKRLPISLFLDERNRGDKWTRIEATLEPLNRNGQLIFNIDEKEDPHMKRLVAQFKGARANSKLMDGPDAVEGAVSLLKEAIALMIAGTPLETIDNEKNEYSY